MSQHAVIYRMHTREHVCPFGLKARDLLQRKGYDMDDQILASREAADSFMAEHNVETTPQVFIEGARIGGYEELRKYLGVPVSAGDQTTYRPVVAVFGTALLMAIAVTYAESGVISTIPLLERFIALSMCVLAVQKMMDLYAFSNQFLGYDLLAQRWVPYAYFYPFGEAFAGICMLGTVFIAIAAPVALFIGTVGAISVFKAVYLDRRQLRCACVGGNSNVPLGFISFTENLMMVGMAIWMLLPAGTVSPE